jgi:hypothetical protein
MVRGAPATRHDGRQSDKALQFAPGDEVTVHEDPTGAGDAALTTSFRVVELLSTTASGQARVYRVRGPSNASFALKVYHADRDPKVRPSEALLARYAGLRHPHLVTVRAHGYGADGIEGAYDWEILEALEPLRLPLDEGPRERWVETTLAPALGKAIDALLSASLVHCDVKPANLMQRPGTGEVVLVDIGSMKGVNASTRESVTTLVATTSAFAAPELLRKHVNDKTDAFSVGMTLFEFARPGALSSPNDKEVVARISRGQPVLDRLASAPRLSDLVNGLTRGDLTSRWGCEEFSQWVSGKQVVEPAPEVSLPVIKWRKQQISTVPALLQVMADEAAFWSMCEDEGELPHTLRQWVHLLHDETVGAALSRLVKRCLADGEPALGVTAIRRVLVPDGPFSVKGRQFGGTPAGAVDAIRAAGAVPADVEVALRLWAHHEAERSAAEVLAALPPAAATGPRGKRTGLELRLGFQELPSGWEGAKFWHRLRIALHGPVGAEELERRAREVILAVPVGTPDGPWKGALDAAVALKPDAAAHPTNWQVWEAARWHMSSAAFGKTVVSDEGLADLSPAQIRALWDWPPGKALLQARCPSARDAGESDAGVEAVLWESGRRWLVGGGLVLEQTKQLCETAVEASVAKWLEGEASRGIRLLRWADAGDGAVRPPPLRGGSARAKHSNKQTHNRSAGETLVEAFRKITPAPSDAERDEAAREVITNVPVGTAQSPWRGSARTVALLAPPDAVQTTTWELFALAYRVFPAVCLGGRILESKELLVSTREDLEACWNWPPGQSILASIVPELSPITDGEEAVEELLRRSGRDWLLLGKTEIREPESLGWSESQDEVLRWLNGPPARARRLLAWMRRRQYAAGAAFSRKETIDADPETPAAGDSLTLAHALLWDRGARGVAVAGEVWLAPTDLAAATYEEIETVLREEVGRAWLSRLGGPWSEALLEPDAQLALHRVWWQSGATKLALDTRRNVERPEQLASLEDCELVLTTLSGRAWLERNGPSSSAALHATTLAVGAHQLWWQAGGTSMRLPNSQRLLDGSSAVLRCSDAEMNELAASEVGRAWFRRQQKEIPADVPRDTQLLRWALGDHTLRLASEGGSEVLSRADWERAPLATVRRVWNGWGPVAHGWMQRLVGEVEWTSMELPSAAGEKVASARLLTRLANRIDSVPTLLLAVRSETIAWENSKPEEASLAALVELELSRPGILRFALSTLGSQAARVRENLTLYYAQARNSKDFQQALQLATAVECISFIEPQDLSEVNNEYFRTIYEASDVIHGLISKESEFSLVRFLMAMTRDAEALTRDADLAVKQGAGLRSFANWVLNSYFGGLSLCTGSAMLGGAVAKLSVGQLVDKYIILGNLFSAIFGGGAAFVVAFLMRKKWKMNLSLQSKRRLEISHDAGNRLSRMRAFLGDFQEFLQLVKLRTAPQQSEKASFRAIAKPEHGRELSRRQQAGSVSLPAPHVVAGWRATSPASASLVSVVSRHSDLFHRSPGLYQFWISDVQFWFVDSRSSKIAVLVHGGVTSNATATMKMSEADLSKMLSGELEPFDAYPDRLMITGNYVRAIAVMTELLRRK